MTIIPEVLKKIVLFEDLSDEMIAFVAGEVHERALTVGDTLFQEGDKGDALYIILDGTLEITQKAGADRENIIVTFKAGDYFGEMALLDDKPRSATARATSNCQLLALDREDFAVLLEKNPAIALQMSRAISERLRKTTPFTTRVLPTPPSEPTAQETNAVRVFISYSRRDKAFVQKLHSAIRAKGLDVWVDWENIPLTADWWAEIERGIQNADAFAFIISPDSLQSRVCGDEVQTAVNANKRLIPILYREATKEVHIPAAIGATNWVYMRSEEEVANNLPEMLRIIHIDLDWVQDHTRLLIRAGEWIQSGRDPSFLLRGTDLRNAETWLAKAEKITDPKPTPNHKEYINASVQEVTNARLAVRRQRFFLGSISLALLTTIFLSIIAFTSYQNADQSRRTAITAQALAESAQADAVTQQALAEENAALADFQRATAIAARAEALEQQGIAVQQANAAGTAAADEAIQRQIALTQRAEAENQRLAAEAAREEANTQRDLALSRQRAAQALSYLDTQPDLAALLSLEAYATSNTLEAKNALLTVLQRGLSRQIIPVSPPVPIQLTPLYSVALSPDGERLAFGGGYGELFIWNYAEGRIEHTINSHGNRLVWSVAFSPDGKTLASGGLDGYIYLWDTTTGKLINKYYAGNVILSITWRPDGQQIALASGARILTLNFATNKKVGEKSLSFGLNEVAWSPDGTKLAVASKDDLIYILDADSLSIRSTLSGHTSDVYSVAWGPDSNLLASGGMDKTVRLWNSAESQQITVMNEHLGEVLSVAISFNGKIVASTGTDRQIILWEVETYEAITSLKPFNNEVHSVSFIPQAGELILAAASRDKTIGLYEVMTEQRLSDAVSEDLGLIYSLSLDAEGTPFALTNQTRNQLEIIPAAPEQALNSSVPETISAPGAIQSAAINLDGTVSALGYTTGRVALQNYLSEATYEFFLNGPVYSMAFSANGQFLAASTCLTTDPTLECENSEVKIWDLETQTEINTLTGQPGKIVSIAFSRDNHTLATGSDDASIWHWDFIEGQTLGLPLNRHLAAVTSLAFSPDGSLLASGSADTSIILWDLLTNQPIGEPLVGASGDVSALVFAEDGMVLYSGGADGSVYQWVVDIGNWLDLACSLAGRNFSQSEWQQFFETTPYHSTCPQWEAGQ
ncbi:MAG: TIR domain-containing protein [Anaerolineales bacterium]|nr:TIR domain-containing protein [Anaerolineales bacterium]